MIFLASSGGQLPLLAPPPPNSAPGWKVHVHAISTAIVEKYALCRAGCKSEQLNKN